LDAAAADPRRDLRYEYENTYSNLIAERWGWMNLLVLNFPYHNAHHVRPGAPWYRLPRLHRSLYGENDRQVITCRELLLMDRSRPPEIASAVSSAPSEFRS
jgi:fatty acid desaturase